MTLDVHSRIGAYEIVGHLGSGGMGEVYRATDTHLGRDVAIKVLPEAFAHDAERLARFEREARTLAALNHPNIAAVYGLEKSAAAGHDVRHALVMELVEGPTLADRIVRGPIPFDETLPIVKQIAEALGTAHEHSIVHRDLKPANIKVRPDGTVKVLDFGLAKAMEPAAVASSSVSMSPTITTPAMTQAGIILGTAAYMSPEQARGKPADRRADIWAFGCVLYEMLTSRRAFPGEDLSETLAAVIKGEPDFDAMPAEIPPAIRTLLRRCLEKDPRQRIADIAAARFVLADHAQFSHAVATGSASENVPRRVGLIAGSIAAAASLIAIALAVPALRHLRETPPPEMRVEISTPATPAPFEFALSPDGRYITFVASGGGPRRLWLRALDQNEAHPLMGTDGASLPFWSADSRSIGFFTGTMLSRIDVPPGSPQPLARIGIARGGTWNAAGTILFTTATGPMMRVQASGGDPVAATRLGPGHTNHRYPHFLPDGRHFLFYAQGNAEAAGLYLGSLDGDDAKRLTASDSGGGYLLPDRVVYSRQGALVSRRLDLSRGELVGGATTLSDSIGIDTSGGMVGFSVSNAGHVAYRSGGALRSQLIWFDRTGKPIGSASEPDASGLRFPALSPDGRRVAVTRTAQGNQDIWLFDLVRGGATRFTFDSSNDTNPLWTLDGTRIVFSSNRTGVYDMYMGPADQPSAEQQLLKSSNVKFPQSWSKDGRFMLYYETDPKTGRDLKVLELSGNDRKTHIVANTSFEETLAAFSPDGRWIAYQTDASGPFEIVVKPFPLTGAQWQVSTAGGVAPRWRPDGKELYFIAPDGSLMAATITMSATTFEATRPVKLFPTRILGGGSTAVNTADYAVAPDGRFLINQLIEESLVPITLILNAKRER